jgi:hypothetical protein
LGVPNILALDPEAKHQYRFVHQALELLAAVRLRLPKSGAEIEFPVDELFAEWDEE